MFRNLKYFLLPIATILLIILTYFYCTDHVITSAQTAHPSGITFNAADKIEIESPEKKLVITKHHTKWHLQYPFFWKINKYAIDQFLQFIGKVKTTNDFRITLYRNNTAIYTVPTSKYISKSTLQTLIDLNFWCNNLFSISLSNVEIFHNYNVFDDIESIFYQSNGGWSMRFPIVLNANAIKIHAFFETFSMIDIEKFLWIDSELNSKIHDEFTNIHNIKFVTHDTDHLFKIFTKNASKNHKVYIQYNNYPVLLKTRINANILNAIMLCDECLFSHVETVNLKRADKQIVLENTEKNVSGIIYDNGKIYECNEILTKQIIHLIKNIIPVKIVQCNKIYNNLDLLLSITINDKRVLQFQQTQSKDEYFIQDMSNEKYCMQLDVLCASYLYDKLMTINANNI